MELIKRTVNLNNLPEGDLFFNISIEQTIDNLGIFTNTPFYHDVLNFDKLNSNDMFGRPDNTDISAWFSNNSIHVSGLTESRVEELATYDLINKYQINFDVEKNNYVNHLGDEIDGVSRITNISDGLIEYVFDAKNDPNIGTIYQNNGILYRDTNNRTSFEFKQEGNNNFNSSLEAIYKEEYLIGVTDVLETKNDIFIDRGNTTVMERMLKMSEVNSLDHLENYGNGYFNIIRG